MGVLMSVFQPDTQPHRPPAQAPRALPSLGVVPA